MTDEEWESKKDETVKIIDNVHTEEELNKLMVDEQAIREPFDTVQFKIYLIPEY